MVCILLYVISASLRTGLFAERQQRSARRDALRTASNGTTGAPSSFPSLLLLLTPHARRKQEAEALRKKHAPAVSQVPKKSIARPSLKSAPSLPPRRRASLRDDEDEEDNDSNDSPLRHLPPPLFEVRPPWPAVCRKCGLDGCSGCACMCEESVDWFDHPDGHFFRKCVECRGDDCPGCACICQKSSVYVEHGGHFL
jgi:hypothetical protein